MASVCILMCFFSVLGHLKLSPQLLQVCGLPAFMVILLFFDDFSSHMYFFFLAVKMASVADKALNHHSTHSF